MTDPCLFSAGRRGSAVHATTTSRSRLKPCGRLIVDRIVVRVRLDRTATANVLLVVLGVCRMARRQRAYALTRERQHHPVGRPSAKSGQSSSACQFRAWVRGNGTQGPQLPIIPVSGTTTRHAPGSSKLPATICAIAPRKVIEPAG
jgi:hypothetical protein